VAASVAHMVVVALVVLKQADKPTFRLILNIELGRSDICVGNNKRPVFLHLNKLWIE